MHVCITICDAVDVDLRHLETFVTVADERSFSRAADRLFVVQSAVSATVRALERDLDVRLFDRSAHRVDLTDAGSVLLPAAREALAAAGAARDAVDELRGGLRGTVRLGVMQEQRAPEVSVPRLMADFAEQHPNVAVELRYGTSAGHVDDVRAGRLDLAYVALPRSAAGGVELLHLRSEEMQLLLPSGHRLADRADVELGALSEERFVDGPPGWGSRMHIDRAFASANAPRNVAYEITDIRAIVGFVHYGLAVAIAPPFVLAAGDDVSTVPIRHHAPFFTTSIARPTGRRLGAAARALLQAVLDLAAGPTAARDGGAVRASFG